MARVDPQRALVPSVLDRLLDDDPGVTSEPQTGRPLRELRKAVRRDLEQLLNTRRRPVAWPEELAELERSLVNYGIPDVSGAAFASQRAREEFLRAIEAVIRRAEPRFASVRVVPLDKEEPLDRTLRFRIDGQLRAEPAPEPVAFDSELQPVSRAVEVKG